MLIVQVYIQLYVLPSYDHISANCDSDEFECDSGECIDEDRQCDDVDDCFDGSDEDGCLDSGKNLCILFVLYIFLYSCHRERTSFGSCKIFLAAILTFLYIF